MIGFYILANDFVKNRRMLGEHGLSLWIEGGDKKILFDTGQSCVYAQNAKRMGLNLEDIDYVVLSHGHYDHTGGLPCFPQKHTKAVLHLHPKILGEKYIQKNEKLPRNIGTPWKIEEIGFPNERIVYNTKPIYIEENITLSGQIPSTTNFEEVPKNFLTKEDGEFFQDFLLDEQMLIIKEKRGIVIFLGCGHPGVVNCLKYATKLYPGEKILGLVGGMHLENVSPLRLDQTIHYLEEMEVQKVIPLHCTGMASICEMKRFLGDRCMLCSAGDWIEL
jgi:7,8-dihydropterin-6-yl-methyl-4-(beta-D-ribofuranosyl)aminobenzene 5'-phosphate synthase